MSWEEVNEIIDELNKTHNLTTIDDKLETMSQKASSIQEYIFIKYNQCILLDSSPNIHQELFLKRLQELNGAVASRFWDDSNCNEEVFYNIALLNFKIHNYEVALRLLDKSINQERLRILTSQNVLLRLHKRCLKAYSLEYLGLSTHIKLKENTLRDAIIFLIGYDVLNDNLEEDDINTVIYNSIKCSNLNNNLIDLIRILSNSNACSLFNDLIEYNKLGLLSQEIFEKFLNEIAHILAHCLSEIRKACGNQYKFLHRKHILFLRISDRIMESLGKKYVTCHATLKIENGEYFSALEKLNNVKNTIIKEKWEYEQINPNATTKDDMKLNELSKQIAQIDFYYWYFSVFERKQDGKDSKKSFYTYCETSSDPVAKTYYNVLNMKELLLDCFEKMKYQTMCLSESYVDALKKEYLNFSQNKPQYSIHSSIVNEWEFLKASYNLFELCHKINIKSLSSECSQEISFYNLYSFLYHMYNIPCECVDISKRIRDSIQNKFYIFKLPCKAIFLCKGCFDQVVDTTKELSISLSEIITKKTANLRSTLAEQHLKNTANILVIMDNDSLKDDIEFIENIISFDHDCKAQTDYHNIYVDTSNLTNEKLYELNTVLDDIESEYCINPIYRIANKKTAVAICVMFALLENHLSRLSLPMDSYLISPVENDNTFDIQACNQLKFMKFEDLKEAKTCSLPDWKSNFCSCYSNLSLTKQNKKVLDLEELRKSLNKYLDSIDYIFYFESSNEELINCHAFNICAHQEIKEKLLFSDVISIYERPFKNQKQYKRKNDMIYALEKLYNSVKSQKIRCHEQICEDLICSSVFTQSNITSAEYKSLRDYLYSYMGILLGESIFLLLQDIKKTRNNSSYPKAFVLCSLSTKVKMQGEYNLCHSLRCVDNYIKDSIDFLNVPLYKAPTIADLEKKIKPCPPNTKYIFISYKSKHGTTELCEPVYKDVIFLQDTFEQQLGVVIDIVNFDERFKQNINKYINNPLCIGSFVYFSFDYMCSESTPAEDMCFQEIKLLIDRKKKNDKFFIIPIHIAPKSDSKHQTLQELVSHVFTIYRKNNDTQRIKAYKKFFDLNTADKINISSLQWQENSSHLLSKYNLSVCLKKNGIVVKE